MKKQRRVHIPLITCAAVILIFSGCSKNNAPPPSTISATIGGQAWQSQYVVGIEPPALHVISLIGYFVKTGDSSQLEIDVVDSLPTGQPDAFLNSSVRYLSGSGATYEGEPAIGGHGSVTITSRDTTAHKLVGTFSGVLYNASNSQDSVTITNGQFSAAFTAY